MNNLVKMAIFLIVVITTGSLQSTIGQMAAAQLDPIVTTPPTTTAPYASHLHKNCRIAAVCLIDGD
jgi:hypothetical protein